MFKLFVMMSIVYTYFIINSLSLFGTCSKSILPSGVSRHELESQIDAAETMKKHYGHEFSGFCFSTGALDYL